MYRVNPMRYRWRTRRTEVVLRMQKNNWSRSLHYLGSSLVLACPLGPLPWRLPAHTSRTLSWMSPPRGALVVWPLQDSVSLRSFCTRANHHFLAPPHLHCPHYCNVIARDCAIYDPPQSPFCVPYTMQNWYLQYHVKANLSCCLGRCRCFDEPVCLQRVEGALQLLSKRYR